MAAAFVPWSEMVPAEVAWFWEALEVGNVPWAYADPGEAATGTYNADLDEVAYILCPDEEVRVHWTVCLLETARVADPTE